MKPRALSWVCRLLSWVRRLLCALVALPDCTESCACRSLSDGTAGLVLKVEQSWHILGRARSGKPEDEIGSSAAKRFIQPFATTQCPEWSVSTPALQRERALPAVPSAGRALPERSGPGCCRAGCVERMLVWPMAPYQEIVPPSDEFQFLTAFVLWAGEKCTSTSKNVCQKFVYFSVPRNFLHKRQKIGINLSILKTWFFFFKCWALNSFSFLLSTTFSFITPTFFLIYVSLV